MTPQQRIIFCAPNHVREEMFKRMTCLEMDIFYLQLRNAIDLGVVRLAIPVTGQLENGGAFDFVIRTTTDIDTIRADLVSACVYDEIGAWRAL